MGLVHDGYRHWGIHKKHELTIDSLGTGLPLPTFPVDCSQQPHGDGVLQPQWKPRTRQGLGWNSGQLIKKALKSWNHQSFNSWKFHIYHNHISVIDSRDVWIKKCRPHWLSPLHVANPFDLLLPVLCPGALISPLLPAGDQPFVNPAC